MRTVLICLSLWSVSAMAQTPPPPPPPCPGAEHRQFDFWIGEWDVTATQTGKVAGVNSIRPMLGGCVLHESYATPGGYRGESFNIYDASRKVWHQSWVDNGGTLLTIEGGLRGGAMVMEGDLTQADGKVARQRITWSRLSEGKVRQHWESSSDGGKTWTTLFDGTYTRRQGGADTEGLGRAQRSMLL